MAQQQQQAQFYGAASAWGSGTRHRPGKLLLGDIQSLQQQQQQQAASQSSSTRFPLRNELATLASAADSGINSSSELDGPQVMLPQQQQDLQAHAHNLKLQQQLPYQQVLPFWKGHDRQQAASSEAQQQCLPPAQQPAHQGHDGQHRPIVFRPGSIGPQFASATLSGSSSSGSGSDSPTALKAVGRVFGNGEVCKLLGFIGAQLLMHFASIQHGMHQLHQRQQGLSSHHEQQQQQHQGPGFNGWRLRMPWQRQESAAGVSEGGLSQGGGSRSNAAWQAGEAAKQWVVRGITAEKNIELREALACYTNAGEAAAAAAACGKGVSWQCIRPCTR